MHIKPVLARAALKATQLLFYASAVCMAAAGLNAHAAGQHHTVVIENMQFNPNVLEVRRGDTVEWINKDIFPHNATADNRSFASTDIAVGKSWQWKAAKRSTISYFCTLHPTMKATLVVK
jgi:plastocyanin